MLHFVQQGVWMGGGESLPKSPSDIPAVKGWFDPSDPAARSTNTDNTQSDIIDKISGATLTASSSSSKYRSASFNSLPSFETNETSRWNVDSIPTGWPTGDTEGWIFALVYMTAGGHDAASALNYGSTANLRSVGMRGHDISSTQPAQVAQTNSTILRQGSSSVKNTNTLLAGKFKSGGGGQLWVDGAQVGSDFTSTLNTGTTATRVGQYITSDGGVAGQFGNMVVTTALTLVEQQFIEGFICWQQNLASLLPSDHPWKTVDPRV
jgi:hypothetical protein